MTTSIEAGRETIAAVIVSYHEAPEQLTRAIDGLLAQTRPPDEILVIDNGGRRLTAALDGHHASLKPITPPGNVGYAPGVNLAARHTTADFMLCLNPDAEPDPDCLERLVAAAGTDPSIALVGAQVLLADHATINAGDNPLHPTGISPSGGYGLPQEHGPLRDVLVVSGACCLIRRAAFEALGGFVEESFLYYEDVDLAWRAFLAGYRVVYDPSAVVTHGYEFSPRGRKWFYLERNRLFTLLANYEPRTLLLLAPLLISLELGLLLFAATQGWLKEKLEAYVSIFRLRARIKQQRARVASERKRSDAELLARMSLALDSGLMPRAITRPANLVLVPYLRLVRGLVRH